MCIPLASGLGRGFSSKLLAIPLGISMASGLGRGFSSQLSAIPMGISMASGLGRELSSNLPAIPMGIPMKQFLWVFLCLVASGECFPQSCQLFLLGIPMASGLGRMFS